MIDLHTHILPGIDDGSRDVRESLELIRTEQEGGVNVIIATPHFYAQKTSVNGFLERRARAYDKVMEAVSQGSVRSDADQPGRPRILKGAEVYYFPGIGKAEHISSLTTEGTNTLLLEMPFSQWNRSVCSDVEDLIFRQGLKIVLAHVERYLSFQKDRKYWERILSLDLLVQFNAEDIIRRSGLFGPDKKKKFCLEYIRNHDAFLLGSDCHNMTVRRPNLREARDEIARLFGEEKLRVSDRLAQEVTGT